MKRHAKQVCDWHAFFFGETKVKAGNNSDYRGVINKLVYWQS